MNSRQIDLHSKAWELWEKAWDDARNADEKANRRYDRFKYWEAARLARVAALKDCDCATCTAQKRRKP
jgi:hypothetical protein